MLSTLRSLLLQCEQYPRVAPVAPTQLHKGLKCKRKNKEQKEKKHTKKNPQKTLQVLSKVLILAEQFLFSAILPEWVPGSQQDAHEFLVQIFQILDQELLRGVR